jgi:hypothetical protein
MTEKFFAPIQGEEMRQEIFNRVVVCFFMMEVPGAISV